MPRKAAIARCYVIPGPNGAGKTTFATEFLPLYTNCSNFSNPDLIARAYSPFHIILYERFVQQNSK